MKIACLQFDPQIGKVQENIHRADDILQHALGIEDVQDKVDILVLPELAFTGYVFDSKLSIRPFLEPTASGITTQWAQATSRRLKCYTIVGYPELADGYTPPKQSPRRPIASDPFSETPIDVDEDDEDDKTQGHSYNACVVTSPDGEVVMNYRKTFLYATDEIWASEGSSFGTLTVTVPSKSSPAATRTITVALGICMDLNPYRFAAPFTKYEFANHVLSTGAQLVIMPMAWETKDKLDPSHLKLIPRARHSSTIGYWAMRLQPLFGDEEDEEDEEGDEEEELDDDDEEDEEEVDDGQDEEEMEDVDDDDAMGTVTPAELEDGNDEEEEKWVKLSESDAAAAAAATDTNFKPLDKVVFVACNRSGMEGKTLFVGSSSIMTIEKTDGTRKGNMANLEALGMAEERLLIADVDI
ncbi:Carbon-nitrogen hydrolase [Orbilia brochopaga]|uniref:Carbon-nitrogen hydrolase n=1 Tax=Orbilia brochopaga TaxID=3140254 RepID=A0AAV9V273_9PEZI